MHGKCNKRRRAGPRDVCRMGFGNSRLMLCRRGKVYIYSAYRCELIVIEALGGRIRLFCTFYYVIGDDFLIRSSAASIDGFVYVR